MNHHSNGRGTREHWPTVEKKESALATIGKNKSRLPKDFVTVLHAHTDIDGVRDVTQVPPAPPSPCWSHKMLNHPRHRGAPRSPFSFSFDRKQQNKSIRQPDLALCEADGGRGINADRGAHAGALPPLASCRRIWRMTSALARRMIFSAKRSACLARCRSCKVMQCHVNRWRLFCTQTPNKEHEAGDGPKKTFTLQVT